MSTSQSLPRRDLGVPEPEQLGRRGTAWVEWAGVGGGAAGALARDAAGARNASLPLPGADARSHGARILQTCPGLREEAGEGKGLWQFPHGDQGPEKATRLSPAARGGHS